MKMTFDYVENGYQRQRFEGIILYENILTQDAPHLEGDGWAIVDRRDRWDMKGKKLHWQIRRHRKITDVDEYMKHYPTVSREHAKEFCESKF